MYLENKQGQLNGIQINSKKLQKHFDQPWSVTSYTRSHGKNLRVWINNSFKLEQRKNMLLKSVVFHLRLIGKVKPNLPKNEFGKIIHPLIIMYWLDYCYSLYFGLSQSCLHRLQFICSLAVDGISVLHLSLLLCIGCPLFKEVQKLYY